MSPSIPLMLKNQQTKKAPLKIKDLISEKTKKPPDFSGDFHSKPFVIFVVFIFVQLPDLRPDFL